MKNIFKSSLLLLCGAYLFASCADDNDSNPTLTVPATFSLNTPAYSAFNVDLKTSSGLNFTWSQPDYGGFPVAAQYQMAFSLSDSFTTSVAEVEADETGTAVADYVILDQVYNGCSGTVDAAQLAKGLVQLAGWNENSVPASTTVYARLAAETPGAPTVYSNTVTINVIPFYVALKEAAPELWYLVGECVGDGSWNNSVGGIGTAIFPLMTLADESYDKATGQGVIAFTGWFPGGKGFKLIKTPGDWNEQWGAGDAGYVKNDGGSGNITVPSDGYYTVKLDTKNNVLTIDPYDGAPRAFTTMGIPGGYNGWDVNANLMNAFNTYGGENHAWTATFDASEAGELKFAADGAWDFNWGTDSFPYGQGTQGGANIPYKEGSYTVFLNDITGQFMFVEK